jgi:AraC family transcriptional regulator, transcriptional activator of pobA
MLISKFNITDLQKRFNQKIVNPDCFLVHFNNECQLPTEPYRTNCFGICLLHKGTTMLKTGLIKQSIKAPAIITMGANVVRSWKRKEGEAVSDVLFFTEEFITKDAVNNFRMQQYSYFDNDEEHVFLLDKAQYKKFKTLFSYLSCSIDNKSNNHLRILKNYISIIIEELDDINKKRSNVNALANHHPTIANFKKILARDFKKERSIKHYADSLFTTNKYLSDQIKKYSGKPARKYIDEMVILEAKIMLQNPDLTIAEISDELHFANQSFFGKFFKSYTEMSPLQYKKSVAA